MDGLILPFRRKFVKVMLGMFYPWYLLFDDSDHICYIYVNVVSEYTYLELRDLKYELGTSSGLDHKLSSVMFSD